MPQDDWTPALLLVESQTPRGRALGFVSRNTVGAGEACGGAELSLTNVVPSRRMRIAGFPARWARRGTFP